MRSENKWSPGQGLPHSFSLGPWAHLVVIFQALECIFEMNIHSSCQNLHIDSLASGLRIIVVGKDKWKFLKQTKLVNKKNT